MRRFVPILIAGIALVATACGDVAAPTRSDEVSAFTRVSGPLGAARNGYVGPKATYVSVSIPVNGGEVKAGPFTVVFPANAVCDRASTRYGKAGWDDPCTPSRNDTHLQAAYWEENGLPFVEFLADLRFDPRATVTLSVAVPSLIGSSDAVAIEYWTRTKKGRLLSSEGVPTTFNPATGTLTRRIKHFSGYMVASGRECDPNTEECPPAGGQ